MGPKEGEIIRLLPDSGSGRSVVSLDEEISRGGHNGYPLSVLSYIWIFAENWQLTTSLRRGSG